MSFKPLDRTEVRTRDLVIDGTSYDQYYEPFALAARHMWRDIEAYQGLGETSVNIEGLRVNIPRA